MSQIINLKSILNSFTLLLIAGIIGLIVSLVAQLFMVMAKNVYYFIFNNQISTWGRYSIMVTRL